MMDHKAIQDRKSQTNYDEYLMAMKRVHHQNHSVLNSVPTKIDTPRVRRRKSMRKESRLDSRRSSNSMKQALRVGIIASMVPDEIISKHCDYSVRCYETALMFCDISGFTDLCEKYQTCGRGGPSKLTKVLNSYIGAMVQEILTHNGDVLKFSGDAFLSMWKKTGRFSMQDIVHNVIDCGLIIQKNYGTFTTDVGVVLQVKVAISAGVVHFSMIGEENVAQSSSSSYVVVGQPVWDVKMAQYLSKSGDVITAGSAWMYVNEAEYCTQPCGDGRHTKVLGVGASWKRVEKLQDDISDRKYSESVEESFSLKHSPRYSKECPSSSGIPFKEFSLRPAVLAAVRGSWWPGLRRFMATPVLRAVDNDEPMDFLTEVRRVVVVFLNIVTKTVSTNGLIETVDTAYKLVSSVTSESGGLVNKVSMFDKDMMFLIVFGLRGLKHEDEAQHALLCAFQIKEKMVDDNVISVSIGVTSGTTYCGVVGHVLRREYTVIGAAVNKAARLMMAYPDVVSCDKETFLRSKIEQEYFRQMEAKPLKGIVNPGPIYQFNYSGWPERPLGSRHPILGRNDEIRKFKMLFQNAMEQQNKNFTRYRDHVYAIAFTGPKLVGMTRLIDECLNTIPDFIRKDKLLLTVNDKAPYYLFRSIMGKQFVRQSPKSQKENRENIIRYSINMLNMTPLQIHGINTIFDCRFPLPESFKFSGDVLAEFSIKIAVQQICKNVLKHLSVLAILEAQHADNESWRLIMILLDTKTIFLIISITDMKSLSSVATSCLENNMIRTCRVSGIDRIYHAALACQLLDVEAIPTDLEKVIESASGGLPGWIQNFMISLVQRGALTIVTVSRNEAQKKPGTVTPAQALLQKIVDEEQEKEQQARQPSYQYINDKPEQNKYEPKQCMSGGSAEERRECADRGQVEPTGLVDWAVAPFTSVAERAADAFKSYAESIYSIIGVNVGKQESQVNFQDNDMIQMAVLADSYTFEDMKVDLAMDAIILKTYDSLNPFEKMLLKCGSVLGDVFSRRMLLHLLQSDSPRKVAQAVAKLFIIRVLECEGGDFTHDTSLVLVHPAPALHDPKPPYCACLGTRQPANCKDLPMYAFCGYMKFRHSLFRTTTYELLTESQKHEMHARALMYLERYTRRCTSCGSGCFTKLLGLRVNDGLIEESEELRRMRRQISAISAESRMAGEEKTLPSELSSFDTDTEGNLMSRILDSRTPRPSKQIYSKRKRVPSFSSLELENCECLSILQSVYCQIIDHCRGAGEFQKLFEAYLEYTDLCININTNIPQAVRLLFEVESFIQEENFYPTNMEKKWVRDFSLASVCSMRGLCMLESGDYSEARKQLHQAMKLYRYPFPTNKHLIKLNNWGASFHQLMALYMAPNLYIARNSGIIGNFYEDIARTLDGFYRLFKEAKEPANASLAAKWCLNFALRTNSNLRLLCVSYANMISDYREKKRYSMCRKLEQRAMEVCRRKRGLLDVTEVPAVCYLYTSIFLFYVDCGNTVESLEFGLSVMNMLSSGTEMHTRESLLLCLLKLLLNDLKIHDMVVIMREFFYLTDYYDLCSETWYYYYAIVILLDTGYCVESYNTCEKFYMKKGDALLRAKTPEAAWNFFVCMWLVTIRIGAWERSILWEEKIKQLLSLKVEKQEFNMMIVIRLVEGLLITLVREMENRNVKKIIVLEKSLKTLFVHMKKACDDTPIYRPSYCLMFAYYNFIRGKKHVAYSYLNKATDLSKQYSHLLLLFSIEHTRNHWKGTLNPKFIDYWTEHIEPDNLLDYRDFNSDNGIIIPYTLPIPTT